ncbi:hypothetical protein GF359_04195 [candidate division WOR-3 bacterium]|uniref:DUF6504 domain-containing protein n=1 Tax=candidate division WOR-3 bacterium TaxID=2052148 RepID=A0A9D5KA23_UNCW3|nr:hypothetical protein [candidate division WOR-3 bacterium]MBD3364399.1 hypothetical protein [candidate division WOR-3 bacterium]
MKSYGSGVFIGERIGVETSSEEPTPVSFTWRDRTYRITKILRQWHDHGFSKASPVRNWRTRRHRNNYIVEVESGEDFEIYLDRGSGRRNWYIYRQIKKRPKGR